MLTKKGVGMLPKKLGILKQPQTH